MEDFRLSTTTYQSPVNRNQKSYEMNAQKPSDSSVQKSSELNVQKKSEMDAQRLQKAKDSERSDASSVSSTREEAASVVISSVGVKALDSSKEGSVQVKPKENTTSDNIVSISRASRVEDFSIVDDTKSKALEQFEADKKEADEKAADKRAELMKELNEDIESDDSESKASQQPITSFAGMTEAQIKTLYQQGRISYQDYMKQTEAKEEDLKEQLDEMNNTQSNIVGLEAIKNNLMYGMPDQIKAEIA